MTSTFDCSHVPRLLAEQRINFFRESSNSARSLLLRVSEALGSARGVFLQGVSLDTGSRDEGSAAIGSFEEKNTASAISPLVVSHVCRTARSFVFVHFAHPVSEKTLRRLFVTKAQPQITCSRRNSPDVVPVAELFLAGLHLRPIPPPPLLPPRVYLNAITSKRPHDNPAQRAARLTAICANQRIGIQRSAILWKGLRDEL